MDKYDRELLVLLQQDASTSNALIGDQIGLSTSQVSRRRARLESEGIICGYKATVDAAAVGFQLNAFVRVKLHSHSKSSAVNFRNLVQSLPAVRLACAITGDADFLLFIRLRDLQSLSVFISDELLSHKDVSEVRSDVVLDLIKDDNTITL